MTGTETAKVDTLDSTFALFFGATEETNGTGEVVREIKGESTLVVVDQAEHEKFLAQAQAESKARVAELDALVGMMEWYEGLDS